jgi:diadenosine tetraphosphate (Ap4A) HIT family hydrolase
VMGDVQFLEGYCLLLPDPVVSSLNDLSASKRLEFLADMTQIGDAILEVTGAARINYEILGNTEPELHAHIFPRFANEPEDKRRMPVWFYDWTSAPKFSRIEHSYLVEKLRTTINKLAEQAVALNHSTISTLNSTSSVRDSEDS